MNTATATLPPASSAPAKPARTKRGNRPATLPMMPTAEIVKRKPDGPPAPSRRRYGVKRLTERQVRQNLRRDQLSQKANAKIDKLRRALHEAREAADALLNEKHVRGCACRVCRNGDDFVRDVSAVGASCGIYLQAIDGHM